MLKYLILPLIFRTYALIIVPVRPDSPETWLALGRGFFSDFFFALCLWFILDKVVTKNTLRLVAVALFIVFSAVNVEHIHANSSNVNFVFLKYGTDKTFVLGSIFTLQNFPLFIGCLVLFGFFWLWMCLFRKHHVNRKVALLAVLAAILGSTCVPLKVGFSYWAQMNVFEENTRGFIQKLSVGPASYHDIAKGWEVKDGRLVRSEPSPAVKKIFYDKDLSGEAMIVYPTSPLNILFVFVEGLSYDLIEQGMFPVFNELKEQGLFYKNFLTLQRQTNRGLYSALCGDYPNYVDISAKMDFVLNRNLNDECLPAALKKKGYYSIFMQSNDLHFMNKGRFARKIGFDEVYGDRSFDRAYARSNWGVDDRTLYRRALGTIDVLSQKKTPWLLTLLTVSTHHPYLVPGNSAPTAEQVLQYANDALREFVESLKDRDLLENTLVVVSSDEAAFRFGKKEIERALSQHHAPLVVFGGPVDKAQILDDYFTQADLLVSFADLLTVDIKDGLGRSVFRRYSDDRALFFGNVYTSQLFSYSTDGSFYVCDTDFDCEVYSSNGDFFENTPINKIEGSPLFIEILKDTFSYNDFTHDKLMAAESELSLSLQ